MNVYGLAAYILIWPLVSGAILLLLCVALVRDLRAARRSGTDLV